MGIMGNFLVSNFSLEVVNRTPKASDQLSAVSFQQPAKLKPNS
jgi:hypothetical protein